MGQFCGVKRTENSRRLAIIRRKIKGENVIKCFEPKNLNVDHSWAPQKLLLNGRMSYMLSAKEVKSKMDGHNLILLKKKSPHQVWHHDI